MAFSRAPKSISKIFFLAGMRTSALSSSSEICSVATITLSLKEKKELFLSQGSQDEKPKLMAPIKMRKRKKNPIFFLRYLLLGKSCRMWLGSNHHLFLKFNSLTLFYRFFDVVNEH